MNITKQKLKMKKTAWIEHVHESYYPEYYDPNFIIIHKNKS
jgi:hypothetical protein